jgi:hypothetical protein
VGGYVPEFKKYVYYDTVKKRFQSEKPTDAEKGKHDYNIHTNNEIITVILICSVKNIVLQILPSSYSGPCINGVCSNVSSPFNVLISSIGSATSCLF